MIKDSDEKMHLSYREEVRATKEENICMKAPLAAKLRSEEECSRILTL